MRSHQQTITLAHLLGSTLVFALLAGWLIPKSDLANGNVDQFTPGVVPADAKAIDRTKETDWVTVVAINPLADPLGLPTGEMLSGMYDVLVSNHIDVSTPSRFVQCVAVPRRDYKRARKILLDFANAHHYLIAYSPDDPYKPALYLRDHTHQYCSHLVIFKP